ncbi:MAG: calcium-binding protein, partial [Marinobacter alexandrii]
GDDGPMVIATTGPGGGVSSLAFDGVGLEVVDTAYFSSVINQDITGETAFLSQSGQDYIVVSTSAQGQAVAYRLDGDGDLSGAISPGLELYVGDSGPVIATSAGGFVYTMAAPGVVQGFAYDGPGYSTVASISDTDSIALAELVALEAVTVGDAEFLVVLSEGDIGVTAMRIGASGTLEVTQSVGVGTGVGLLSNPTEMQIAHVGGKVYVLVASAADNGAGGALTVMLLGADGFMHVTDHILDSLDTRFGTVAALEIIEQDGWTYVVAGGGDSGLSVFALAPGGRLLLLDSIEDTNDTGLETISAISLLIENSQLNVFAASQATQGLAHLSIDLDQQGLVLEAGSGDATGQGQNDLLVGGIGNNVLRGMDGDDILMDGYGDDTLWGGAGADTFVLERDGRSDEIRDFEPGQDRIDLSAVSFLYDASRLTINEKSWGAELVFPGGEITLIYSANGGSLSAANILEAINWELDRPPLTLLNQLEGDDLDNLLTGSNGADIIRGLGADDVIEGQDGDDWIDGGWGSDTVLGGDGADVLNGDLGQDLVEGGAGDDMLIGVGGFDHIEGGDGEDELWGGTATIFWMAGRAATRSMAGRTRITFWGAQGMICLRGSTVLTRSLAVTGMT